ncbi:MAG: GDP-mannose 4,6-dehydratase [Chloroflexota bacterium]
MESLRQRRILVTGADGFIGSHLVERLVADGAHVRAFCFYNSRGSHGWLDGVEGPGLEYVLGDIRDERFVREACKGIEVVFHLAALVSIPHSYQAAASFVETNIGGTLNVLEAVHDVGCARLVHTSTSEVYGTPEQLPIREDHPLKGQSPYSATKIAADKLCEAFARSHGVPVVVLRPFNTFGPRQSARAVIPTILTQLLAGKRRIDLGTLQTRRDFTYVDDTVDGFVRAGIASLSPGEVIQLGTGRSVAIGEVIEISKSVLGVEAEVHLDEARVRPVASEVEILQSDPAKAERMLGWRASVGLEEGIRRTASWLSTSLDQYRPDAYSI